MANSATTGKPMPIDAEPAPDGNLVLDARGRFEVLTGGLFAELEAGDRERYRSHFARCPDAKEWRK